MALVLKDRVKETTTTTGTGTYTLAGAVSGFEAFSEIGNSNTTYYCCTDGTDFEVGIGTYTASGTTLARTTILQSSNSDAAVNWTSGTRTIFCTQPAEKAVFLNADGDIEFDNTHRIKINSDTSDPVLAIAGGGPNFIRFHDSTGFSTTTNAVDIVYRTTPNDLLIERASGENIAEFGGDDGHAALYFNDSKKLETVSGGIDVTGEIAATSLDISGDVDVDGTLEADAITLNGTSLAASATTDTTNASNIGSGTLANARLDQQLQDVAGLAVTNGNFIVGDGSNFVAESGSTARTSLGLGTAAVLDTGISNTNVPKFTSGVADNDFLRVDGTAIEGRSASQVLSDIGALGDVSDDTSPTLGGALSTGGNQIQLSQTSGNAIVTTGGLSSADLGVLRASAGTGGSDTHGFTIKYMGSRSGNNNSFALFMDNQTGTDVEAITVLQDGKVGILNTSPGSALDVTGEIAATSLDISGDVDVDGTLEADAITLNGTSLAASATTDTTNASNIGSGTLPNARLDAQLQDVAGLAVTNGNFIVGDGSNFVAESGSTARASLGLGTAAVLDTGISNTNVPKFTSGVADNDFLRVDGTAIEGRSASEVLSDIGGQASLTFGISNTNAVKIDSTSVADDEYARFTANGLESRSTSEVLSDIGGQASLTFGISNTNAVKIDSTSVADDEFARFTASGLESRSASEVLSDIAAMPLAGGTFTGDVTLTDTDAGSAVGPLLTLNRNSSSPADADLIGTILFKGENDADQNIEYGRITGKILDNTDGTEDGGILISVTQGGSTVSNRITCQGFGPTAFNNKDVKLNSVNLIFEGATTNEHETTLTVTDPTGDRTITLPDATGTVQLTDGSGASLTSLNASQLSSGTVPNARLDAQLQDVAGLAVTNGNFIVGDGSNFVAESGSTARASLGLGTIATQASNNVSITGGSVSGITDLAIADGGTGASSASAARTNLGLGTAAVAATGISNGNVPVFTSGVADDDFLRVNGTSIEGRSVTELASDIGAATTDDATALAIALG